MALPGDITTITVTGTYLTPSGVPMSGTVTFTPSTPVLVDTTGSVLLGGVGVTVALTSGVFSVVLPCTGQLNPAGWTYTVVETIGGLAPRSYSISIPHTLGSSVDISTLTPVVPSTFTNTVPTWTSVRSYGAAGNGSTDDTAAIQAAVTAAGSTSPVYFPEGTYLISAPINLVSGGSYFGDGWGSVIKQKNGANQTRLLQWPSSTNSNCSMRDLMVDGNRANNGSVTTYGIYTFALQYSTFRNVRVQQVNGDGWRFDGATGGFANTSDTIHLLDCWSYGNTNNGLVTTSFANDVHIVGGDYGFNGSSAITFQGGSTSLRGATLWGTTGGPGLYAGGSPLQVTGCNIEGNSNQGVLVDQFGSYLILDGCKIYDNSTAGSGLYDGVLVNGVTGTPATGVSITNCFIFPNLFPGGTTQAHAVNLGAFHQQCTVVGNTVGFAGVQAVWSPSNALVQGQGTSDYVANNPGFNPMGFLSSPSVASSGTVVTNPWGVPVTVYVTGGTVTQIAVGGHNTGLTSGAFAVPPGGTITLTYSVAPSWVWMGE